MDKAAIKLHKMNIFPKVPPLYTHLPSTFLPVFSGTMLPNGLPVSCLPPPDSIPPIVGATTGRPRVSGVICTCRDRKKGRSMTAPTNPMSRKGGVPTRGIPPFLELLMGFGSRLRARSRSGSDSPPDCHSLPSRRFATTGLSFTTAPLRIPLARIREPRLGLPYSLELLMGFGPMTSSLPMTCSTD